MKEVVANTAPVWVENRRGEQVVEIDQIGAGDYRTIAKHIAPPNQPRNRKRCEPMPAIVQDRL